MPTNYTRRDWLKTTALVVPALYLPQTAWGSAPAPAAPVAIGRIRTYASGELVAGMQKMFDQLGGVGRLVKGKTVAIKVNFTGGPASRLGDFALEDSHFTHPSVIAAATHLLGKAGARRIRILESAYSTAEPLEEYFQRGGMNPREILGAAPNVEFENTSTLGNGKKYSRVAVPGGGHIFPGFDLNHSYEDCDVFVSLAKMKEHGTAGVTLSMKNCFGVPPYTIYGMGAGLDEPSLVPKGPFRLFHDGSRGPSKSAPQENDPTTPRLDTYRVPRIVTDLVAARPIHLAIVEGVKTMTGGEGPWVRGEKTLVAPGVVVAGLNPVNTDAVSMAVMGFDPMADRGTPPFESCDSTLRLAEEAGLGTRDLRRIEVRGATIAESRFDFAAIRRKRRAA